MAVDADKVKQNAAAVMALAQGELPEVVSPADLERFEAVLTPAVQAARSALLTERRARIPVAKAAPVPAPEAEADGEDEAPETKKGPAPKPAPPA
ncbi:MAG: hypothetical protein J0L75_10985, partial [Spirochaetes bacterium]|nr:hypothetical protein [Spirochaetota bacterium]